VEVKIQAVSPLLTSANAGKEIKLNETIKNNLLDSIERHKLKFINNPQKIIF
jgi:hypothetical protein